eukprot:CAMPEP_0114547712 /NCGR_PEP_ID=MMETSP0114-20121206/4604_1 /TAXON_ID=31324 /ORGANISM="Goniomonas sp, Strain m" /LENGTH=254 /DNA_ID=CAMNT_0001732273 /DNA_START=21 /DNA_END=785 /DNA_ORIENTATION=-
MASIACVTRVLLGLALLICSIDATGTITAPIQEKPGSASGGAAGAQSSASPACRIVVDTPPPSEFPAGQKFDLVFGLETADGKPCGPKRVHISLIGPHEAHFGAYCPKVVAHKENVLCRRITSGVEKGKKVTLPDFVIQGRPGGSYELQFSIGGIPVPKTNEHRDKAKKDGTLVLTPFTVSGPKGTGAFSGALERVFSIIVCTLTGVGIVGFIVYKKVLQPMQQAPKPNGGGGKIGGGGKSKKPKGGIGGYGSI